MGIYIKGMEMPADDMKNIMIFSDGRVFQFSGYGNPKPLGTAVPVPAHGRLIDKDAIRKKCEHGEYPNVYIDTKEIAAEFYAAPTIIPAEEGET